MQRWEYLLFNDHGKNIFPGSHRLQQVYQHLKSSLPHLGPKELKIDGNRIENTGISLVDLMNVLGADGWEVVEVAVAEIGRMTYVLKRPTG